MALLSSNSRKKASNEISSSTGLRIVILPNYSNTIVVKSGLKSLTQTTPIITTYLSNTNTNTNNNNNSSSYYSSVINYSSAAKNITTTSCSSSFNGGFNSFLKSCHLCKKPLCPDKDVYMYRGDQGFCSIECRSKQIMVDETKEMNANTKNRLRASSIDYCQGCETCKLLDDLRHRRIRRNNKLKPLITPAKHQPFALFLIV